jgi:hypothetical protein
MTMGRIGAVLVVMSALGGCPLTGVRDSIGLPCFVDGESPCGPDHICEAEDGALGGVCAPIVDYGATCDPPTYPQQPGAIRRESLDVGAQSDLGFLDDVARIEGDLVIDGPFGAAPLAIGTLCGVAGLQQVTGSLFIAQTDLATLDGLQSLSFVGAGIGIAGNPALTDLMGLANLVRAVPLGEARFSIVIAENRSLPREALRNLREALADRPSISIAACGNLAAAEENDVVACGADINRFLRRQ